MRAVAEYVMRGRNQARWVAVVGAFTPIFVWLSAAVLALVTLRKGPGEGLYLLAWAVLPAAFTMAVFNEPVPLVAVLGTTGLAVLLRWTVSWPLTLLGSSIVGLAMGVAMLLFGLSYLEASVEQFAGFIAGWQAQLDAQGESGIKLRVPGVPAMAGMFGTAVAFICIVSLLLARWWQSSLYNPGGFRTEFHGLRYPPAVAGILLLLVLGVSSLGPAYNTWALLFALPLSIAGLALVHARAAYRGYGSAYLTLFYMLWVLLNPVQLIVIGLAVADSLVDFRSRWQQKPD